jgi:exopolysaccharide biosynthesis polyprenyl glycosylphosphotransferase
LIVGTKERAEKLIDLINRHAAWGLRVAGLIVKDPQDVAHSYLRGVGIIGVLKDIPKLIQDKVIDEVIFAVPLSWLPDLDEPLRICEDAGIDTRICIDWFSPSVAKSRLEEFDGFSFLTFSSVPDYGWSLFFKYLFDRIISLFLLFLLAPVFFLIAVGIKITSPGMVFFTQIRSGLNGRKFKFYKFRSMVMDAEGKQDSLLEYNEMSGPIFKMKNDPRIIPFGRFLRRISLDELPQLYNVLKGEMSLVGPRPPLPSEVAKYDRWQRRRISMKPGITGLWQVSGRNELDFNRWMELDLRYIDNWSLWLDFKILVKTIWVVLTTKGAW